MNNLTNEQIAAIREAQVKAASAGFAQSLINHGFTEDMAKNATIAIIFFAFTLFIIKSPFENIKNPRGKKFSYL